MSEFEHMIKRQRKWMLYLLVMIVLGAGFSPYPKIFNGLLLGSVVSFYNLWNLQRNVRRLDESVIENKKTMLGIGTFTRIVTAGLAILITIQFEVYFNIIGVVLGLLSSYVIIFVDFGIRTFSHKN